jgi:hypothetical protein
MPWDTGRKSFSERIDASRKQDKTRPGWGTSSSSKTVTLVKLSLQLMDGLIEFVSYMHTHKLAKLVLSRRCNTICCPKFPPPNWQIRRSSPIFAHL